MRFDKQSFLAGLHTGLRLGRDPIGRRPPPPSGRYIWTEEEKKILTEYEAPSGNMTIYNVGAEYEPYCTYRMIDSPSNATGIGIVRATDNPFVPFPDETIISSDARFFVWARRGANGILGRYLVLYSTNSADIYNAYYYYYAYDKGYTQYPEGTMLSFGGTGLIPAEATQAEQEILYGMPLNRRIGDYYVFVDKYQYPGMDYWRSPDRTAYYRINGCVPLDATGSELVEILENASPEPLITE